MATSTVLEPVSNDAKRLLEFEEPYVVNVTVKGTAPILFHAWSVEGVESKSKAAKGSKAKKEDDLESYVYRDEEGNLAIPTEYFRMSMIHAAKFKQDPRSPRKSAMDLFKAGIVALTFNASFEGGAKTWDYVDRRRVTIQRSAITRSRPALNAGWKAQLQFQVLTPEYVSPTLFNEVLQTAGRLVGVGDYRPTYGRFQVVEFESTVG